MIIDVENILIHTRRIIEKDMSARCLWSLRLCAENIRQHSLGNENFKGHIQFYVLKYSKIVSFWKTLMFQFLVHMTELQRKSKNIFESIWKVIFNFLK